MNSKWHLISLGWTYWTCKADSQLSVCWIYILKVLQPVWIVSINRYKRTIVSRRHWKSAIGLAWDHYGFYRIDSLDIKNIIVLNCVEKVSILSGEHMEQLIRTLKIVRNNLNIYLTSVRKVVTFWDPGFHRHVLLIGLYDQS